MIIPNKNYGINEQTQIKSEIDKKIEDISINETVLTKMRF